MVLDFLFFSPLVEGSNVSVMVRLIPKSWFPLCPLPHSSVIQLEYTPLLLHFSILPFASFLWRISTDNNFSVITPTSYRYGGLKRQPKFMLGCPTIEFEVFLFIPEPHLWLCNSLQYATVSLKIWYSSSTQGPLAIVTTLICELWI